MNPAKSTSVGESKINPLDKPIYSSANPPVKETLDRPSENIKVLYDKVRKEKEEAVYSESKEYVDIVVLEDNFYIRFVMRHLLGYLMKHAHKNLRLYSSEEGIQGLGYVMVTMPDLVIIDSTLPQYSGKEVLDFLLSNTRLMSNGVKVLILKDGQEGEGIDYGAQVKTLVKRDKDFIQEFVYYIDLNLLDGQSLQIAPSYDYVLSRSKKLVSISAKVESSATDIVAIAPLFKLFRSLRWFSQIFSINRNMVWLFLLTPRVVDDNVAQEKKDLLRYRVRSYSAFLITLLAFGFLVVQLVLLWLGKGIFNL